MEEVVINISSDDNPILLADKIKNNILECKTVRCVFKTEEDSHLCSQALAFVKSELEDRNINVSFGLNLINAKLGMHWTVRRNDYS